ncbi:leucine-rich repeat domain-containing protein [Candidatus Uabimicrobium amorphum]|uniref:Uncharacterized protein n=1 Tax=Uabimicrobium amorphum TaxID=2596890 RepID=A0A5S9IKU1_UABAM|nr:hypothetical protein [Candidatus Uabimicrobium amorphum]BBM82910.1 hypothetical protein UABAM_01253 [Candidatus Uabimicrobium amorphum]
MSAKMNKVARKNVHSIESNTCYDGCAIYISQIVLCNNVIFCNCSFREREVQILYCEDCSFTQCNFHSLELNFCKNLVLEGGCMEDLAITKGSVSWIKSAVQVKKMRVPVCSLDFNYLQNIKNLQSLDISARIVNDRDLEHLQLFSQLEDLNLSGTKISEIAPLQNIKHLCKLDLSYNSFRENEWKNLGELKNLEVLNLGRTNIKNANLEALVNLTNLRFLYLGYTTISTAGLETLLQIPQLEKLELPHTYICDEAIEFFKQMSHLKHLGVYSSRMSRENIEFLREEMPWCCIHG